ncbi:hypothetical protein GALMADRAFT_139084 [Galerina marginata CBS 339.88]|uniref:USP domain-containing protein n=1 Tax=Galerina marginata (strain CBS 339.88) TaxID=685588 RepID=A0A067T409_GALM3|nr:hypothetical protein GALMADRAFT_139084 [Galerina marginata CBS 339.88]
MTLAPGQEPEHVKEELGLLASFTSVDSEIAGQVLRKYNGDMEMAADALLAEETTEGWNSWYRTYPEVMYLDGELEPIPAPAALPEDRNSPTWSLPELAALPSTSLITLTTEDGLAIQLSMQEASQQIQSQPHFGPRERALHPRTADIKFECTEPATGSTAGTAARDGHKSNETIQASLRDFEEDEDRADVSPFKATIREGGRPIALRTDNRPLAYAALVVQALYFVPQVRATVSNLRLPKVDPETALDHPDRSMWNLIELFTNMDLSQLSAIVDKELLPSLEIPPFDGTKLLGEASSTVVKSLAHLIEQHLKAQTGENEEDDHLFSFIHGQVTLVGNHLSQRTNSTDSGMVVAVEFGQDPQHNDLNSCISDTLTRYTSKASYHDVIIKPSDVIIFELKRLPVTLSNGSASPDSFSYPKTIYLDQFLFDNLALANSRRKLQIEILGEIEELRAYEESLTLSEGHDPLLNLRSTIHHYKNVVIHKDPVHKRTLQAIVDDLKDTMADIQREIEDVERKIETLQAEIALLFDCPELQVFRYDLRSVLMHTGLPGSKEMFSYVQDTEGTWWKTVGHEVTGVTEETVFTDPDGSHLGADPYMLFYSRYLSEEQIHEPLVWPTTFSKAVEKHNRSILTAWRPEFEILLHPTTFLSSPPRRLPAIPEDFSTPPLTATTGIGSSWSGSPLLTPPEPSNALPQELGEERSSGSSTDAFSLTSQSHSSSTPFHPGNSKPGSAAPASAEEPDTYNPHMTAVDSDAISFISVASSRTASTDYGVHYRRWALSQDMNSLELDPSRGSWGSYQNHS